MGADNMAREIDGGRVNRGPLGIGNILGRGILRTTDAPPRGQVITIPKPVAPQPDIVIRPQPTPEPEQPPTKKPGGKKKPNFFVRAIAAGSMLVAGGVQAKMDYDNIPAVHRIVDNLLGKASAENALDYFDPDAMKGTIREGVSRITVSEDVLRTTYKEQVEQNKNSNHPVAVYPVKFGDRSNKELGYERQAPIAGLINAETREPIIEEAPGAFEMRLTAGDSLIIPAEDSQVFKSTAVVDGQRWLSSVYVKYTQNGQEYAFAATSDNVKTFIPQNGLIGAPDLPTGNYWREETRSGSGLPFPFVETFVTVSANSTIRANFSMRDPETGKWNSVAPDYVVQNSTSSQNQLIGP